VAFENKYAQSNLTNETSSVVYHPDKNYWKEVYSLYANVLDASGINLKDPIYANISRISRTGKRLTADPPYVGKSFIFVTRPDLNFGGELEANALVRNQGGGDSGTWNCRMVSLFDYVSRLEIGRQIMPFLMYPNDWPVYDNDFGAGGKFLRNTINGIPIPANYQHFTPFIPLFSNTCTATSGGKDINLETYETEGDFNGNKQVYVHGADETFGPGEITLSFNDLYGSPVLHMINLWVMYMHYASKGICVPRRSYIKTRTLDYTCSIYIFMLDIDGRTILRWAKYTGCFPRAVPLGEIQHSADTSTEALRNLSVAFAYNKYEPMKPLTFLDFNVLCSHLLDHVKAQDRNIGRTGKNSLAPDALLVPEIKVQDIPGLNSYSPPKTTGTFANPSDTAVRFKTKDDYDQIHWGRCPFVVDHQLLWY
jgi:hypothetical protein